MRGAFQSFDFCEQGQTVHTVFPQDGPKPAQLLPAVNKRLQQARHTVLRGPAKVPHVPLCNDWQVKFLSRQLDAFAPGKSPSPDDFRFSPAIPGSGDTEQYLPIVQKDLTAGRHGVQHYVRHWNAVFPKHDHRAGAQRLGSVQVSQPQLRAPDVNDQLRRSACRFRRFVKRLDHTGTVCQVAMG